MTVKCEDQSVTVAPPMNKVIFTSCIFITWTETNGEPRDKASMLMSGLFVVFNVIIDLTIIVVLLYFR